MTSRPVIASGGILKEAGAGDLLLQAEDLPIATSSVAGAVKPDGTTITVDTDGTIHATSSGADTTKLIFAISFMGR